MESPPPAVAAPRRPWTDYACMAAVGLVFAYSLHLACNRIYQVDEAQNVFMGRILGMGAWDRHYTHAAAWLLGPLAWIARAARRSEDLFTSYRLVFLAVYWTNVVLLVRAAGARWRGPAFWQLLLLASTLAPLLDYGLEIRHDNLLLTALLVFWFLVRKEDPAGPFRFVLLGFLSGAMQLVAFKAFLTWVPLALLVLAFPPPALALPWRKRVLGWAAGFAALVLLASLAYALTGTWPALQEGFRQAMAGASSGEGRFGPLPTLLRLLNQMPLLSAGAAALLIGFLLDLRGQYLRGLRWEGSHPEAVLLMVLLAAFLVNPVPYPYNLIPVAPFLLMLVARGALAAAGPGFLKGLLTPAGAPFLVALLAITHLLPFAQQAARHLDFSNGRQHLLMATAERMTDPERDPVFDASGLVATRWPATRPWFLHSISVGSLRTGKLESISSQLARNPAAVLISSYRTDWLPKPDQGWIRAHYLPLADDFWVLGANLPAGGGTFACLKAGRYLVAAAALGDGGAGPIRMDGQPQDRSGVQVLSVGAHAFVAPPGTSVQLLWLGPKLLSPPVLTNADHRLLFVNWY